jgi:hypothetical protein
MKRIAILGSTGSIGRSALAVVDAHPDRLSVAALAAGENAELLGEQIARYRPAVVAMASGSAIDRLRAGLPAGVAVGGSGREGLVAVATAPDVDVVLCASSGTDGLEAVLAAIEHKKTIALANKEVLVMAGGIVTEAARRHGALILPVDSEHNALHQCLHGLACIGDPAAHPHGLGRTVSRPNGVGTTGSVRGGSAPAPDLADGPENHDRLGDADEQGARGHRGALVVWRSRRPHRRRHPPAVGGALDGGADRWFVHRAARRDGHAPADSVRVLVSGTLGGTAAAA